MEINKIIDNDKLYIFTDKHIEILNKWIKDAHGLKLMHEQAHNKYWCLNAWFNIPVITISTITGTGSFAINDLPLEYTYIMLYLIGGLNILGGILSTLSAFIGSAQLSESHRLASISWSKFSRKIQLQLSTPESNINTVEFMFKSKVEYDNIIELSPSIPYNIVRWFKIVLESGELENNSICVQCLSDFCCIPFGCIIQPSKKINIVNDNNSDIPELLINIKGKTLGNIKKPLPNIIKKTSSNTNKEDGSKSHKSNRSNKSDNSSESIISNTCTISDLSSDIDNVI